MLKALRAMRQASREYKSPPITIGQIVSITAVVTVLHFLR
jgi:hypothetical protein